MKANTYIEHPLKGTVFTTQGTQKGKEEPQEMSQSSLKSLGAKSNAASNQLCWQSTSVPFLSWTNFDGDYVL